MKAKEKSVSGKPTYAEKVQQIFQKIILLVLACVCIIMIVSMIVLLNQRMNSSLENEVTVLSNDIDAYMAQKISCVETAAAAMTSGTVDGYDAELALVDSIVAMDDMVSAVYIAYPDESLVYSGGWLPDPDFVLTNRPWYTGACDTEGVYLTDPYVDETTGQFCVTLSKAVMIDGKLDCIVGMDLYLDAVIGLVSDTFEGSSYSFLVSADGTIMAHPDEAIALSADHAETLATAVNGNYSVLENAFHEKKLVSDYSGGLKIMISSDMDCGWKIVTVRPVTIILIPLVLILLLNVGVFLLAVIISRTFGRKAVSKWFEPLIAVSKKMHLVAEGDLTVQFDEEPITEEIAVLTDSLNTTISTLKTYIEDISHVVRNVAKGNLTVHKHVDYQGDFIEIEEALDDIIDTLNLTIAKVIENAGHVSECSDQVQSSTEQVASGASAQNMAIAELAEHIHTLSDKIHMIMDNTEDANRISVQTNDKLGTGNEKMQEVVSAMEDIDRASDEIGNIIATINELADQTTLLALNASIEAARAGEAGKGFAVVADEIGKLAAESTESSSHIADLINGSKAAVERGKNLVADTAEVIRTGVENSMELGSHLQQIGVFVGEQDEALKKISEGVEEISSVIETNAAASEEDAAISQELTDRAEELQDSVKGFVLL